MISAEETESNTEASDRIEFDIPWYVRFAIVCCPLALTVYGLLYTVKTEIDETVRFLLIPFSVFIFIVLLVALYFKRSPKAFLDSEGFMWNTAEKVRWGDVVDIVKLDRGPRLFVVVYLVESASFHQVEQPKALDHYRKLLGTGDVVIEASGLGAGSQPTIYREMHDRWKKATS